MDETTTPEPEAPRPELVNYAAVYRNEAGEYLGEALLQSGIPEVGSTVQIFFRPYIVISIMPDADNPFKMHCVVREA